MLFVYQIFFTFSMPTIMTSHYPPAGSVYNTVFSIPFIGNQNIEFNVIDKTNACITMSGLINRNGSLTYTIDKDGRVEFTLGTALQNVMRTYMCSIKEAYYNAREDTAQICLKINPLQFRKTLVLKKKITNQVNVASFITRNSC